MSREEILWNTVLRFSMHLKIIAITFVIVLLPIKTDSKIADFFLTLEMLVF